LSGGQACTIRSGHRLSARVAPPEAEGRACSSLHQRERALAPGRDDLLAECSLRWLIDVAFQAEQVPFGYLPGGGFVHDGLLPAQPADEAAGRLAPRVVGRFGVASVLGGACRCLGWIACLVELGGVVVVVAGGLIDAGGHRYPGFVVERSAFRERPVRRANSPVLMSFTLAPSSAGPVRSGKMSVRAPPG
jgi:hypothetical protein